MNAVMLYIVGEHIYRATVRNYYCFSIIISSVMSDRFQGCCQSGKFASFCFTSSNSVIVLRKQLEMPSAHATSAAHRSAAQHA